MLERMLPIIASAIVVVLQVVFAPILTIFSAVPNFIVAFILVFVVLRRSDSVYLYAFVLGLISDLLAETPVGLTPLLLLPIAFVIVRAFEVLDDSSFVMPLVVCGISIFIYEFFFMIVLMIVGYEGSFIDLFLQRALPSTIFNCVIAVIFFVIMRRLPFTQVNKDAWKVSQSRRYR